jgi:hypothetical protein
VTQTTAATRREKTCLNTSSIAALRQPYGHHLIVASQPESRARKSVRQVESHFLLTDGLAGEMLSSLLFCGLR